MAVERADDLVIETAMDWLMQLRDRPDDPALQRDLQAWLAQGPEHRLAWERARRTWSLLGLMPPEQVSPAAPPRAAASPGTGRPAAARRPPMHPVAVGLAVAALAACLAFVLLPAPLLHLRADHVTATAETGRVTLPDGSLVDLAPESAIAVRYAPQRRGIALLSGRAFFTVVPDAGRPFTVEAASISATALGTAYEVSLSEDRVAVGVAEGLVALLGPGQGTGMGADTRLAAGDRASVDLRSGVVTLEQAQPEAVAAWRDGRLFVADASVEEVVARLRPYHPGWILVADEGLAQSRVNGLYDLEDPERALRALVRPFGGEVRHLTPLLVLLSRP